MPGDANRDNVYEVTVRASDGGLYADRMVMVTVTDAPEGPTIMGADSVSYAENGEGPVATFTATDPEGATPITWAIAAVGTDPDGPLVAADAVDAASFEIDKDGMLKFAIGADDDPPDFEVPRGTEPVANGNTNTYRVVVVACDLEVEAPETCTDGQRSYHKVTVKVTDVAEAGKVTWTVAPAGGSATDLVQFQVGAVLTATASDGDITNRNQDFTVDRADVVTNVRWLWFKGNSPISGTDAEDNTYTVTSSDVDSRIRAEVHYQVGDSTTRETASLTSDHPVLADRSGDNKLKFDPTALERSVQEGDKGMNVGAPVTATGNHGAVNYTLADAARGDNEKFKIDQKTGQITTLWDLNRDIANEATAVVAGNCEGGDNECVVTVRATDASGDATATSPTTNVFEDATVTIKLTDVNEKPTFVTNTSATLPAASPTAITMVPENSTMLFGLNGWMATVS